MTDLRRVLDDKSVDAVVVATPDHWHAPAAILACEAGKHVYVEKPQSHNLRESRLAVNYPFNCDSGAEFYGTAGRMFLSKRGKLEVYGERDRRIDNARPKEPLELAASHQAGFLDAIRTGRTPTADVAEGHESVALVHLANIAVRLGRSLRLEAGKEAIAGDEQANALLSRKYREGGHWAIPKGVRS